MKIHFSSNGEIVQTKKIVEKRICDLCKEEIVEGQHTVKNWHAGCYCKLLEKREYKK